MFALIANLASEVSTAAGKIRAGWIRLARMASMTNRAEIKPYVIAVRPLKDGSVHFGCSCPDWIHRKRYTGDFCKHQKAFLAHEAGTSPHKGVWLYKAGQRFLEGYACVQALRQSPTK